jgi:hypothetical protein
LQTGSGAGSGAGGATGAGGGDDVVTDADALEAIDVAAAFVAVTVNVYAVDELKPVTFIGEALPVAVIPPGDDVTVYLEIALLPLLVGAVNETVTVV